MKILLDENLPAKLKYDFGENHTAYSVRDMDWLGKKNGELLKLAVINKFDVIITLDKNLKHQQSILKFEINFIILLATDSKHQTLQPFMEKVKSSLDGDNLPKISEIFL